MPTSLHTAVNEDSFFTSSQIPEIPKTQVSSMLSFSSTPSTLEIENITPTVNVADLPMFVPTSTPNFRWGDVDGEAFTRFIDSSYEEVVHWR